MPREKRLTRDQAYALVLSELRGRLMRIAETIKLLERIQREEIDRLKREISC